MNALDRLARALSGPAHREDGIGMTRRDLARRGGLAVLSLGALGQLALPRLATAAPAPCPSLAECLHASLEAGSRAWRACLRKQRRTSSFEEFSDLDCRLWDAPEAARAVQKKCFADCKPPRKPPRKPPSRPGGKRQAAPPPLPPNPYGDLTAECANCASVGGACCFGGPGLTTPGGLCACATEGVECRVYGC